MISKRKVKEEILENIAAMTDGFGAFLYAAVISYGSLILSYGKFFLCVENDESVVLLKFIEGLKKEYNIGASLEISGEIKGGGLEFYADSRKKSAGNAGSSGKKGLEFTGNTGKSGAESVGNVGQGGTGSSGKKGLEFTGNTGKSGAESVGNVGQGGTGSSGKKGLEFTGNTGKSGAEFERSAAAAIKNGGAAILGLKDGKGRGKRVVLGEKDTAVLLDGLGAAEVFDGRVAGFVDGLPEKYRNFEGMRSFFQLAFLKNGVVRTPDDDEGGYYAEVSFDSETLGLCAADELNEYGIKAKTLERNESLVLYIKDGESVGGFLALVQAHESALKLQEILVVREERNNSNRRANCDSHNLDKSAEASVAQTLAITKIAEGGGLSALSEGLKKTAEVRLENHTASLNELAEMLGVTKSCVQHRLKKLVDIADEMNERGRK
ncbi:MAG: DNA-binding protein WhiA [Clostridiales bacterium]|jgi:DNA-binding protein WhiA|nr:DNA-binding protein WhiA [Clostridiales bacterium]